MGDNALDLYWTRDGKDWVLRLGRRKLGRVFPDNKYPGMWRSKRADGRLSDMANLSWAKHAAVGATARDIRPSKMPIKQGVFSGPEATDALKVSGGTQAP